MKLILYITFFILLDIAIAAPPRCLTTENVYYDYKHHSITYNEAVDWWYLHSASHTFGSFYTDSNLSQKKKVIQLPLFDVRVGEIYTNPFYKTYQQINEMNTNGVRKFSSIVYNEQIEKSVGDGAHAKGFFIWNNEGGIHVMHSNPNTPWANYGKKPAPNSQDQKTTFMKISVRDGRQHAQHHFCRTIGLADLNIIPKYIIFGDVRVVGINGVYQDLIRFSKISNIVNQGQPFTKNELGNLDSNNNKITFQDVSDFIDNHLIQQTQILFHLNKWVQLAKIVSTKLISSTNLPLEYFGRIGEHDDGDYFIQSTIKSYADKWINTNRPRSNINYLTRQERDSLLGETNYNILYQFVSQQNGYDELNWICQTETKLFKSLGNLMPYKRIDNLEIVSLFAFEWNYPRDGHINIDVSSGHDHTKLFYGYSDDDPELSIMCIGDLNWQGKQELRGGGLFCSNEMAYLANYMRRHALLFRAPKPRSLDDFTPLFGATKPATPPLFNKYLDESVKPNSGALFSFNFIDVKSELLKLTNQNIARFNFEIRTLLPLNSNVKFLPLPGQRIIIMNNNLLSPKYSHTGVVFSIPNEKLTYNCGYESVNIPLLVQPGTINNINVSGFNFQLEEYSFNVFTSKDINFYICDDDKDFDCDYEDSEYVQLFTHAPQVTLKVYGTKEYKWDSIKVTKNIFEAQYKLVVIDLVTKINFIDLISKIKNTNPTFTKTLKLAKHKNGLQSIKFNEFNRQLCEMNSADPNSIIIQYYDKCFDVLYFCLKRNAAFNNGDNINTADGFRNVFGKFKNNHPLAINYGECFDYTLPLSNPKNNVQTKPKKVTQQ